MNAHTHNPFSPHKDVLEAPIPETAADKQRFMLECKTRATAAVKASVWPDALALYQKAIQCCDDNDDDDAHQNKAILYANLSLVHGKMNQWDAAASAAQQAVQADPTYTKAWWRAGQAQAALQQWDGAVQAMQEAVQLEPQNKALKKELEKLVLLKTQNEQVSVKTVPATSTATTTGSSRGTKKTTTRTASSHKPTGNDDAMQVDDTGDDDDEEEETFTKSEHVKGYQVVNGKKTTFFHNELSEEAAKLIGDIAPKKLETTTTTTAAPAPAPAPAQGTSAWNKAGTWEDKDVSQWAQETLTQKLRETSYALLPSSPLSPSSLNGTVTVTSVDLSGHASVATVRGKKRYIYEYAATVYWKFENNNNNASNHMPQEVTGSMQFPDIDGACVVGEPYDVTSFQVDPYNDDDEDVATLLRPVLEKYVHEQGFREALHHSIDAWVQMFRETY